MNIAISQICNSSDKYVRPELVKTLQNAGYDVAVLGNNNGTVHPWFKENNVKFIDIKLKQFNLNPFKELASIKYISRILKENNIEALLAYNIRTFPTIILSAKNAGIKTIVVTVNGLGRLFSMTGIKGLIVRMMAFPILRVAFKYPKHVFVQNRDDLKYLIENKFINESKSSFVPGSGVNIERFSISPIPYTPFTFSMIGRLIGLKGVNVFVKSAIEIKKRHPETRFLLVGPMDEFDKDVDWTLVNSAKELGVIEYIHFVEDVKPYLDSTTVFVFPSKYREGIPRCNLEAMSVGRPVITSVCTGCKETVVDGYNGFLVNPDSVSEIVDRMEWYINNQSETEVQGKNSRHLIEEKFDMRIVNNEILNELKE